MLFRPQHILKAGEFPLEVDEIRICLHAGQYQRLGMTASCLVTTAPDLGVNDREFDHLQLTSLNSARLPHSTGDAQCDYRVPASLAGAWRGATEAWMSADAREYVEHAVRTFSHHFGPQHTMTIHFLDRAQAILDAALE